MNQSSQMFKYYYDNYVEEDQANNPHGAPHYISMSGQKERSSHWKENYRAQPGQPQTQKTNLKKRKKKKTGQQNPKSYAQGRKRLKQDSGATQYAGHSNQAKYTAKMVLEMIKNTDKNPIALLHEYLSKVKKAVTYKFSIRNEKRNVGISRRGNSIAAIAAKTEAELAAARAEKKNNCIFQCQIFLEKQGMLSQGAGYSKKAAKNTAGEQALATLVNRDFKATNTIGGLIERQMKRLPSASKEPDSGGRQGGNGRMRNQSQVKGGSKTAAFPPPPSSTISLICLIKSEGNYLSRLSFFANSMSMNLKWKFRHEKGMYFAECYIGSMRAGGHYRQKKTAKILAARNMIKLIDSDPIMKQKFLTHLQSEKQKQKKETPALLSEAWTNFTMLKKYRKILRRSVESSKLQQKQVTDKKENEPTDMIEWFNGLDKRISAQVQEMEVLRMLFDNLNILLQNCFNKQTIQLIPVGSYVLNCVRIDNLTIDTYLHLEKTGKDKSKVYTVEIVQKTIEDFLRNYKRKIGRKKQELQHLKLELKVKTCPSSKVTYLEVKDPDIDNPVTLKAKMRLFVIHFNEEVNDQEKPLNRYTSGIYHSNWLVQNFSQSENAWQAMKLFRFVREWRDLKKFYFLPSEILDLTLKYATYSFDQTGYFRVLLKFFTLMTLMLSLHNKSFFEISESHAFLIDQITESQKQTVKVACQKTFLNLSVKNTDDFMRVPEVTISEQGEEEEINTNDQTIKEVKQEPNADLNTTEDK